MIQTPLSCKYTCFWISTITNLLGNLCFFYFCFDTSLQYMLMICLCIEIWQMANIVISLCCIFTTIPDKSLKVYLKINIYLMGLVSALVMIGAMVYWALFHCKGEDCVLIDAVVFLIIFLDICVGVTGTMMMIMSYNLSKKSLKY